MFIAENKIFKIFNSSLS